MRIGDHPVAVADDQMARGVADVDAMIGVRRVPDDAVVLFVEAVHRPPSECDAARELGGVCRQRDVLPSGVGEAPLADAPRCTTACRRDRRAR